MPWVSVSLGHHNSFLILCRSPDLDVLLYEIHVVSMPNSGGVEWIYLCSHLYNLVFAYAITSIRELETTKGVSCRSSWAAITISKVYWRLCAYVTYKAVRVKVKFHLALVVLPEVVNDDFGSLFRHTKKLWITIFTQRLERLTFVLCLIWSWPNMNSLNISVYNASTLIDPPK